MHIDQYFSSTLKLPFHLYYGPTSGFFPSVLTARTVLEYRAVEEASCPCNRGIKYLINIILDYGAVEGASCPNNRRIKDFT
jgi:hypothetical protein